MAFTHDFVLLNKNELSYDDCCKLIGKNPYFKLERNIPIRIECSSILNYQ